MSKFLKSPFLIGLWAAISVVIVDVLQMYMTERLFDWNGLWLGLLIAFVGYIGQYLSGLVNTSWALLGSALVGIVPLITSGSIDWKLIIAAILIKLIGLGSNGLAAFTSTTDPIIRPDKPPHPFG